MFVFNVEPCETQNEILGHVNDGIIRRVMNLDLIPKIWNWSKFQISNLYLSQTSQKPLFKTS